MSGPEIRCQAKRADGIDSAPLDVGFGPPADKRYSASVKKRMPLRIAPQGPARVAWPVLGEGVQGVGPSIVGAPGEP